jgi:TonB family protein
MSVRLRAHGAIAASVVLHGAMLALGAWLLARSLAARDVPLEAPALVNVEGGSGIELPVVSGSGLLGEPEPSFEPRDAPDPLPGGGEHVARPDLDRRGRGGTDQASEAALNLASSNDGLTLDRDPLNRFDRSQVQRLKTASERRSLDDRRATPNPMQLSLLASGEGQRALRREPSRHDPSRGILEANRPSSEGTALGASEHQDTDPSGAVAGGTIQGARRAPGAGVLDGAEASDHRRSASVLTARPLVSGARAAVPASERARTNDTRDSSQEVAARVASLIHASTAGGRPGSGPGGSLGGPSPGSSGFASSGSRSAANGVGPGARRDDTPDPRLMEYFRRLQGRVDWLQAFPDWAKEEGRGGLAIIGVSVLPDGRLAGVRVVRPSGVREYDQNLIAAVRRAAPFEPVPTAFNASVVTATLRFDAVNPAVGRDGPGPGRRH